MRVFDVGVILAAMSSALEPNINSNVPNREAEALSITCWSIIVFLHGKSCFGVPIRLDSPADKIIPTIIFTFPQCYP
jgi:hypothetical protein